MGLWNGVSDPSTIAPFVAMEMVWLDIVIAGLPGDNVDAGRIIPDGLHVYLDDPRVITAAGAVLFALDGVMGEFGPLSSFPGLGGWLVPDPVPVFGSA